VKSLLKHILIGIPTFFLIVLLLSSTLHFSPQSHTTPLSDHWTISLHGKQYDDLSYNHLPVSALPQLSAGDRISTFCVVDADPVDFPALIFRTRCCAFRIYMDNRLIYDYPLSRARYGHFLGWQYHIVSLPQDCVGHTISFRFNVIQDTPFSIITTPWFGCFDDLIKLFLHRHILALFSGIFLCVFGICFLLASIIFASFTRDVFSQIISALLCLDIGIWILSAMQLGELFTDQSSMPVFEHIIFFLAVPLLYLLLGSTRKCFRSKLFLWLSIPSTALCIPLSILSITSEINIFPVFFILIGVLFGLQLYYGIIDLGRIQKENFNLSVFVQMSGAIILTFGILLTNAMAFRLSFYVSGPNMLFISVLPVCSLLFVITRLSSYLISLAGSHQQHLRSVTLSQLAYMDALTGLPNRARSDQLFKSLSESSDDFCLISLDLNGLKEINDLLGHPAGDRLLVSFADTLRSVFIGYSCCRTGGDEFLVIMNCTDRETVEKNITQMNLQLKALDSSEPDMDHSTAYGYAFRHECPEQSVHDVYMLADQRMYECKRKQHEQSHSPASDSIKKS
jgi:diguanylate cyclase (GGDEF)-like protein